jgi:penicillin-insensitive murein DD-endopeptidase
VDRFGFIPALILGATIVCALLLGAVGPAAAQDIGTLDPKPLPPLANPDDPKIPAKELFGRRTTPAKMPPKSIGFYSKGCLAGGVELPINGDTWQVMRLSRNRNWGHPNLIKFLERLSVAAARNAGWPGLLVGDMSQPRGGPMLTGHASHQVGLDADIWLSPMPDHELTRKEREEMSATNVVATNGLDVDPALWTPAHGKLIKAAAEDPEVERIFVNPAIKKELCREAGNDHSWLDKVRPWWGHDYHFHVRIRCPAHDPECKPQPPAPPGDGCGHALDWWFTDAALHPPPPKEPESERHMMTLSALPKECRQVLLAQ